MLVYPIALGQSKARVLAELAAATGSQTFLVSDARRVEATPAPREDGPRWHAI